jgi:uncharacterized oxidoreductase
MALRHQLKAVGIKVYEVIPPAVDTELNPEGRAKRAGYRAGLGPEKLVAAIMTGSRERRAGDRLRNDGAVHQSLA